jgi:hypothetical protein
MASGNAPNQKKNKQKDVKEAFYLDGNLFIGRLNSSIPSAITSTQIASGQPTNTTTHYLRQPFRVGFNGSLGVILNKDIEIVGTYFRAVNKYLLLVTTNPSSIEVNRIEPLITADPRTISLIDGYVATHLHDRFQIVNVVIKSRWFAYGNQVFVMPFIGARGILIDRDLKQVGSGTTSTETAYNASRNIKEKARTIGIIGGTDLNFYLNPYLFFYGSAAIGATAGKIKVSDQRIIGSEVLLHTTKRSEDFRKFFDGQFGLALNFDLGRTVNVLMRVGVNLFFFESSVFNSTIPNFGDFTDSDVNATVTQTVVNTYQALVIGGRITF